MGYTTNIDFNFNPSKDNNAFDPSDKTINGDQNNPYKTGANPYIPSCGNTNTLEKLAYRNQVAEYIDNFGQRINYWSNGYNYDEHDYLYGESPTSRFRGGRQLKAIIDFSSYTTFLTRFGMMSDADITIYLSIDQFKEVWGPDVFPIDGDLFEISDSACDRPQKQSKMIFEITDRSDMINPVDYLGGHYYWKIIAKRFDYSYQEGAPVEKYLDSASDEGEPGICDTSGYGKIPLGSDPESINLGEYPESVDEESQKDMDNSKTSASYGNYL